MIAKILDGVFFFLVFKACQYFWDLVFSENVDLVARIDYLEDEFAMIREAVK